jgi:hypothetical protein
MKKSIKLLLTLMIWISSAFVFGQPPQFFNYQAVVRNNSGETITNKSVGVQINIRDINASGPVLYQENHTQSTNQFGILELKIGEGIPAIGSFSAIDWRTNAKFIEVLIDIAGGSNYISMGSSELLSVPYALFSDYSSDSYWNKTGDHIYFEDGNVGIGTSNPGAKLDIRGTQPDDGVVFRIGNSDLTHSLTLFGGRENDPNPFIHWKDGDPLRFSTDLNGWSEKMRITSDGNLGIGTTLPSALLHTYGLDQGQGNVLFTGEFKEDNPGDPPVSGAGTRLMWYPDKAAFRVGTVIDTVWDKMNVGGKSIALGFNTLAKGEVSTAAGFFSRATGDFSTAFGYAPTASGIGSLSLGNFVHASGEGSFALGTQTEATGNYSTALGMNTKASGQYSTAIGYSTEATGNYSIALGGQNTASGINSTAMGMLTIASGNYSTAMGYYPVASGDYSTAMGFVTSASGNYSTAMGYGSDASSFISTAIGRYNVGGGNINNWVETDPLFEIGIGVSNGDRRNALTVLKNGNVGIGSTVPQYRLDIRAPGTASTGIVVLRNSEGKRKVLMRQNANGSGAVAIYNAGDTATVLLTGQGTNYINSGNLGIGTTSPQYRLDVLAPGTASTGIAVFRNSSGDNKIVLRQNSNGSGSVNIYKTDNQMSLSLVGEGNSYFNGGNLGIGTDQPASILHVKGSGWPGGFVMLQSESGQTSGIAIMHELQGSWRISINPAGNGLRFSNTALDDVMFLSQSGNVGIGTTTPVSRLDVRGNVTIRDQATGNIAVELGTGLDYAEGFDVSDREGIEAGIVLCIDSQNPGKLIISSHEYDTRVAGIVAGANGLGSGISLGSEAHDFNVALAGRVYCWVDATNEKVEVGDLLTTSSLPGHAMKANDHIRAHGAILGKAMESLEKGQKGQILVLVTLH